MAKDIMKCLIRWAKTYAQRIKRMEEGMRLIAEERDRQLREYYIWRGIVK